MSVDQEIASFVPADLWSDLPGGARVAETHSAVLVFDGDRVYKRKKALDLGFLDFRERRARLAACRAEVELNSRLAPDVYLGVADVHDDDGEVCDHAVVMRRMPAGRQLTALLRRGVRIDEELRAVARAVAAFHERCETSPEITRAGDLETVEGLWREGLAGLEPFRATVLDADLVDEIGRLALRYLAGRGPLFAERQRAGRVRDGHGDLQADDIYCLADGPRVLDCIEFDRRLRIGDVLGDIAFLAMDLERLDAPDDAQRLMGWYREFSGEVHPPSLEHLYIAYRAFVRAKVTCIRHRQASAGPSAGSSDAGPLADDGTTAVGTVDAVADAGEQARRLAEIAYRHLRRARVRLVLVGGLPGTGKSTLAGRLVNADDGRVLIRSDVVRKELVRKELVRGERVGGEGPSRRPAGPQPPREGIYRPEVTDQTYGEMLSRARRALERGETVILDASWSDGRYRAAAARLARETAAEFIELRCVTSPEVAVARLARRAAEETDASDATAEVHQAMRTWAEPWPTARVIQTGVPAGEAYQAAERCIA